MLGKHQSKDDFLKQLIGEGLPVSARHLRWMVAGSRSSSAVMTALGGTEAALMPSPDSDAFVRVVLTACRVAIGQATATKQATAIKQAEALEERLKPARARWWQKQVRMRIRGAGVPQATTTGRGVRKGRVAKGNNGNLCVACGASFASSLQLGGHRRWCRPLRQTAADCAPSVAPVSTREPAVGPAVRSILQATRLSEGGCPRPVLIFGGPGAGKTFALKRLAEHLREGLRAGDEAVAVLAAYGLVAEHAGGYTIHSWAGIGIESQGFRVAKFVEALQKNRPALQRWKKAKALLFSDASLISAELLDLLEAMAREVRGCPEFFGGLLIVLEFDLMQLFPVSTTADSREALFRSQWWDRLLKNALFIHLTSQHRFSGDGQQLMLLQALRAGKLEDHHHTILEDLKRPLPQTFARPTHLAARRTQVGDLHF